MLILDFILNKAIKNMFQQTKVRIMYNRRLTWENRIIEKNIHSEGKTQENIRMCFIKKKVKIIRDRNTNGY